MQRHVQWKFGFVALLGFAACSESPAPTASVAIGRSLSTNLIEQPGQQVASGIAQALANSAIRLSVLQAFRASPLVEHKLVLQQFIATTEGRKLVAAAAIARGVTVAEFTNQINALPPLDFYVPSRSERLSWSGGDHVDVALSTSMAVVPTSAYTSQGKTIPFASAHAAGRVLFLLHPVEAKGRRMQRQAALAGSTIQDSDDGELGVQFIQKLGNGDTVVYDLQKNARGKWMVMQADGRAVQELAVALRERIAAADPRAVRPFGTPHSCDIVVAIDECDDTGGGSGPQPSWTNVVYVRAREVCDMDCNAGNEFEFRASAYNSISNALVLQGTARITGVGSGYIYYEPWIGSTPMIATTVAGGVYISVDVVETDGFPNPDDHFNPNPTLFTVSDKNKRFDIGDNRSWAFCTMGEPVCKSLSVDFNW